MYGRIITKEEALYLIKKVIGMKMAMVVIPGGNIRLEFGKINETTLKGDYSIVIYNSWVIDSGKLQKHYADYVSLRDEEKLQKFLNASTLSGIDFIDKFKIISFVFNNKKVITIVNKSTDNLPYFCLFSNIVQEKEYLCLDQDFKFKLIPTEDDSAISVLTKRLLDFVGNLLK